MDASGADLVSVQSQEFLRVAILDEMSDVPESSRPGSAKRPMILLVVVNPADMFFTKHGKGHVSQELHQHQPAPSVSNMRRVGNKEVKADSSLFADHRGIFWVVRNPVGLDVAQWSRPKTTNETSRRPTGIKTLEIFSAHFLPPRHTLPVIELPDMRCLQPPIQNWKVIFLQRLEAEIPIPQRVHFQSYRRTTTARNLILPWLLPFNLETLKP